MKLKDVEVYCDMQGIWVVTCHEYGKDYISRSSTGLVDALEKMFLNVQAQRDILTQEYIRDADSRH